MRSLSSPKAWSNCRFYTLFPTPKESNDSLVLAFEHLGYRLVELEDWNCCGCGTFLTVAKPEIVTPMVDQIVQGAVDAEAHVIVTACAMCYMNLEVRCSLKKKVPILHFSELLSLAFGLGKNQYRRWFSRNLVNPRPLLKAID